MLLFAVVLFSHSACVGTVCSASVMCYMSVDVINCSSIQLLHDKWNLLTKNKNNVFNVFKAFVDYLNIIIN